MNYYGPRQRVSDGRWDYTRRNNGTTWPCGYCSPTSADYSAEAWRPKFHGEGHATREEACQCYLEYSLDHETRTWTSGPAGTYSGCQAKDCGALTAGGIEVLGQAFHLCDAHRTREVLAALVSPPDEIASSY